MKYFLIALLLTASEVSCIAQTGNSEQLFAKLPAKYPMESGTISFTITGEASGLATLYFDRNGWREVLVKEVTFERFGMTSTEKTVTLVDGDFSYQVNLDSKKGVKTSSKAWGQLLGYKDKSEVVEIIMQEQEAIKDQDTLMLDNPVSVWTYAKGSTKQRWLWEGVLLKEIKSLVGIDYEMTAQTIDTEAVISPDVFELPEGITWD